jgi:hypothetical protein
VGQISGAPTNCDDPVGSRALVGILIACEVAERSEDVLALKKVLDSREVEDIGWYRCES